MIMTENLIGLAPSLSLIDTLIAQPRIYRPIPRTPTNLTRRQFLKLSAIFVGGLFIPGCKSPPKDLQPLPTSTAERKFGEFTLEQSLQYLQNEIKDNPNLTDLYAYGDEKTFRFLGHTYNVWTQLTGSNTTADQLLQDSVLGNNKSIGDAENLAGTSTPRDDYGVQVGNTDTTNTKDGRLTMQYNRDAYYLQSGTAKSLSPGGSILSGLLVTATHEPFHYLAGIKNIAPQALSVVINGQKFTFDYDTTFGFALHGTQQGDTKRISHLGALDEASVLLLQSEMIAPKISFYPGTPIPYPPETLTEIGRFFKLLGYDGAASLLKLRSGDKPAFTLMSDVEKHLPPASGSGYEYLILLNYDLFSKASTSQITQRIDMLTSR